MHQIKYALFYDFHTSPQHPDVGKNFDAEKLTDRFVECGVDYVTFHARCNMGMAYYNTELGTRHPHLDFDLFGQLAEACRRKGIGLGAYFNVGLSRAEGIAHRDWTTVYPDGQMYHQPFDGPFSLTMCYNSPYRGHLIGMALEVARKYPVSGFFFDCMSAWPCVCPNCVRLMQEQGVDCHDKAAVQAFAVRTRNRFAEEISAALRTVDPEYLIYFNDVPFETQQKAGSYLEFECLPCKSGGYAYMNVQPHYMRTLGKTCVHMTGRFNRWSDFGGLRNAYTLKYELFFAMANGMRPNIGDHLSPDGHVNETVFNRCKEVFGALRKYDRWFDGARPLADAAIVWHNGAEVRLKPVVSGAVRMLTEMKMQFDIVTTASSWDRYQLLIFPDDVKFDDEIRSRVEKHVARGGFILASGASGLDQDGRFPAAWGVDYVKKAPFTPAYFLPEKSDGDEVMPFSFYDDAHEVVPHPGTRTVSPLVRPAINREWTGIYPEYYNPPWKKTDLPFLAVNGRTIYCSGNIFLGYARTAPVPVRDVLAKTLEETGYRPLLKVAGAPSFLQLFVNRIPSGLTVSMLACIPEKRGSEMESVEDELTAGNFELSLKLEKDPGKVFLVPDGQPLKWQRKGDYITFTVPEFTGFGMIAAE